MGVLRFGLAWAFVALGTSQGAAKNPEIEITPTDYYNCIDFAGQLVDIECREGSIYLLDFLEKAIWNFGLSDTDVARISIGSNNDEISAPRDLFFACDDRMFVTDIDEKSLFQGAIGSTQWERKPLSYRAFYGAGCETGYVLNASRSEGSFLARLWSCSGDSLGLGEKIEIDHEYQSVSNNLNYTRLAVSDSLVAIGHIALPYVQVYRMDGRRVAEIDLAGDEVDQVREYFLNGKDVGDDGMPYDSVYVADLVRAAEPERFPVPVYIADMQFYQGMLYVLVNNSIHVYEASGELVKVLRIAGKIDGERVLVHDFTIDEEGSFYGVDLHHYKKVYRFDSAVLQ